LCFSEICELAGYTLMDTGKEGNLSTEMGVRVRLRDQVTGI